jgi:hypothetical protein
MSVNIHSAKLALSFAIAAATLCVPQTAFAGAPLSILKQASFLGKVASTQVRVVADQDLPFIIVDKVAARLFLFDRQGILKAASPVLLGMARGDVSPPGVGNRKLSSIAPADRITPAGRFVANKGIDLGGKDIVWVDYDAAIAIHRATDIKPGATARDRLARLASASADDKRISYGCINVSEAFYDAFIRPVFTAGSGIVYILPESQPLATLFPVHAAATAIGERPAGLMRGG